jgi:MoaA/NifB/PqqE/SkfB family radical SAM enzyme
MKNKNENELELSTKTLYRLPWNFADNSISWLEPTSKCNLYCDGCYRENRVNSHKTLEEIEHDLDIFEKFRRTDGISIAGGEPLIHPQICDIVRMVRKRGWKPVINSNGIALTRELLKDLIDAGVDGFTFHIDSGQQRPNWKGKNELELNELRLELATMLYEVGKGNISCSFNATIYPENLKYLPELAKFAQKHIDKINVMVFILYRMGITNGDHNFFVGQTQVHWEELSYTKEQDDRRVDITSPEAVEMLRTVYPDFMPSAFLNGSENPGTFKWLLTGRAGNKHQIFGYAGQKFMEIVQVAKHFATGSYLAYSHPKWLKRGRLYFLLAPFDKGIRRMMKNYFASLFKNPKAFFSRIHFQSIMIIQPADVYADGRINMCDGCPDISVWNDELVWSCRMEEQMRWGENVRLVPKGKKI